MISPLCTMLLPQIRIMTPPISVYEGTLPESLPPFTPSVKFTFPRLTFSLRRDLPSKSWHSLLISSPNTEIAAWRQSEMPKLDFVHFWNKLGDCHYSYKTSTLLNRVLCILYLRTSNVFYQRLHATLVIQDFVLDVNCYLTR